MSYNTTMDIRPIAWAGYFVDPRHDVQCVRIDPPDMDAESLVPILEAECDCPCD